MMNVLRMQVDISRRAQSLEFLSAMIKRLDDSRTSVIGAMRSTPVALGTTEWNEGDVSGAFDLSAVPDGDHHLILDFADAGVTLVASVSVSQDPEPGSVASAPWAWALGGAALVGVATLGGALLWRRRN